MQTKLTAIEQKLKEHRQILDSHEKKIDFFIQSSLPPKQGVFFDGQIYDAYSFVAELVRKAARRIVLIDNYIDDTVLTTLSKRSDRVDATIYTCKVSKQLQLDIDKHNAQYPPILCLQWEQSIRQHLRSARKRRQAVRKNREGHTSVLLCCL